MKKYIIFYLGFTLTLVSLLTYYGCSELEKDLVQAPAGSSIVHGTGWLDKSSANFHGVYIANQLKWKLDECRTCHGSDYKGGASGSSCITCHTGANGPEFCGTCHGNSEHANPPLALNGDSLNTNLGVGAHMKHLVSTNYSALVNCNECHTPVNSFNDTNHIGTNANGIAEINFGPIARTILGGITPNPVWDRNTASCSSVYCHGKFKDGNQNNTVTFTSPGSVVCGSCHGDPATGNPTPRTNGVFTPPHYSFYTVNTCYFCHGTVINQQGQIIDSSKHVNGVVNGNSQ